MFLAPSRVQLRIWKEGRYRHACLIPAQHVLQAPYPTTVYFLFDTGFVWIGPAFPCFPQLFPARIPRKSSQDKKRADTDVSRLRRILERSFRGLCEAREQSSVLAIWPLQSSYGINASALPAQVFSGCSGLGWSGTAGKRASRRFRGCAGWSIVTNSICCLSCRSHWGSHSCCGCFGISPSRSSAKSAVFGVHSAAQ